MDYINYVKQSPFAGFTGYGGGATGLAFRSGAGPTRAVWWTGNGDYPNNQYVDIQTTGNATVFGSRGQVKRRCGATSNGSRGVAAGGYNVDSMSYITISTAADASSFGSLVYTRKLMATAGDQYNESTRGVWAGSDDQPSASWSTIDYVTISNTSNASDFGDLDVPRYAFKGCASSAGRGVFMGGYGPGGGGAPHYAYNTIDYITLASTGNTTDFGNLYTQQAYTAVATNGSRGIKAGGNWQSGNYTNVIEYVTIANTGNASDFGDMLASYAMACGAGDETRCVYGGGFDDTVYKNEIFYITAANTGNATDFGDLVSSLGFLGCCGGS